MPRTKVNRKGLVKRNRLSATEEKLEAKLREFDELGNIILVLNFFYAYKTFYLIVDVFMNDCECEFSTAMSKIETMMTGLRGKTPQNILQMKWSELKQLDARTFAEVNKTQNLTGLNGTTASTLASLSTIVEEMRNNKKAGRSQDEGKSVLNILTSYLPLYTYFPAYLH